jgi:uncharacterized membrane protein YfcA
LISDVAIQIPANTATSPSTRFDVIGSPTSWVASNPAATGSPSNGASTWLGLKLFGRLDEASFRRIVLAILLASGIVLII